MRSINLGLQLDLAETLESLPSSLSFHIKALNSIGWQFLAVNAKRGYCSYKEKVITIPAHAFSHRDKQYLTYYIAHEVAHAVTRQPHNEKFARFLKPLLTAEQYKYELAYKPRAAKAAGMAYNPLDDM